MVLTDTGKSGLTLGLIGSINHPQYLAVGDGSGAVVVTNTGLVTEVTRSLFESTDASIQKKVTWTASFSSVTMSGTTMTEFGVFAGSSGGTIWNREGFAGIEFDGTNELQVDITFEVF